MVRKGGQLKVHARSTWGEGGQKRPKNGPHGLCMPPNVKKITVHTEQYFPVYMKPDLHFRLAIAQS